jgi:hypothetical protein
MQMERMAMDTCSPPPEDMKKIDAAFPIYEVQDSPIADMKRAFRAVAIRVLEIQRESKSPDAKRSAAVAFTELETASMFAVKAIHQG